MNWLIRHQTIRFIIAGAGGAALLFVLSFLLAHTVLPPFIGNALAYCLSFGTVYLIHRSWTFSHRVAHRQALPRYLIVQLSCAGLSGALAHLLVHGFGFAAAPMAATTTIVASAASYFATSYWAFAKEEARDGL